MGSNPIRYSDGTGPFRADQIRNGDPYELSDGHPVRCVPSSELRGRAKVLGALVLASDPAVRGAAGTDVGVEFNEGKNLRAPDLSIGIEGEPGWSRTVPPLVVEYADRGQDEAELSRKIVELLAAGTRYIWVVRLVGPLRVEVYGPGKAMRLVDADGVLAAPGVLKNDYPVRALTDVLVAQQLTLRNLLQQEGYESVEQVRAEGHKEGHKEGELVALAQALLTVLSARGLTVAPALRERILGMRDAETLTRWIGRAATCRTAEELLG